MSAILGLVQHHGRPITADDVQPALHRLERWQPQNVQVWTDGAIMLAHVCVSSALAYEDDLQPLSHPTLPITMTTHARLDNRQALCEQLHIPPDRYATIPNSELILEAYLRWGTHCADHLFGDFTFAIWDAGEQRLFCGRDHIGTYPLFYYHSDQVFAFASSLEALLLLPGVQKKVDEIRVAYTIAYGPPVYEEQTYFEDIKRLLPAHTLIMRNQHITLSKYWQPPRDTLKLRRDDDYVDALLELLTEAVTSRMRTVPNVGAHLSGGMDSSVVSVLAGQYKTSQGQVLDVFPWFPPPTYSYEDEANPELQYAKRLVELENFRPHYLDLDQADPRQSGFNFFLFDLGLRRYDQVMPYEHMVQQKASDLGIRVMLSGWGGDQGISYGGDGIASAMLSSFNFSAFLRYLRLQQEANQDQAPTRAMLHQIYKATVAPYRSDQWHRRRDMIRNARVNPQTQYAFNRTWNWVIFTNEDFRHRMEPLVDEYAQQLPVFRIKPNLKATMAQYFNQHTLAGRLEAWYLTGADYGLTYLYPLLDRRIIEFAHRLPWSLHYRDGKDRYLWRLLSERLLPKDIAQQAKQVFTITGLGRKITLTHRDAMEEQVKQAPEAIFQEEHPWLHLPRLHDYILRHGPFWSQTDFAPGITRTGLPGIGFRIEHPVHIYALWYRHVLNTELPFVKSFNQEDDKRG